MKYKLAHDIGWQATVLVVDKDKALKSCKEVNEFFTGSEDRLDDFNGDVIQAALSLYASQIIANSWAGRASVNNYLERCEGFFPLDGSHGLYLEACDRMCWGDEGFDITEEH